jgi:hypothetical protein
MSRHAETAGLRLDVACGNGGRSSPGARNSRSLVGHLAFSGCATFPRHSPRPPTTRAIDGRSVSEQREQRVRFDALRFALIRAIVIETRQQNPNRVIVLNVDFRQRSRRQIIR